MLPFVYKNKTYEFIVDALGGGVPLLPDTVVVATKFVFVD